MERNLRIKAPARFLWHEFDGALRFGIGRARTISSHDVVVESATLPSVGSKLQVLIDATSPGSVDKFDRLLGKGVVVQAEGAPGEKSGFAARVLFLSDSTLFAKPEALHHDETADRASAAHDVEDTGIHEGAADTGCLTQLISSRAVNSNSKNLRAARIFAVLALLLLLFSGKVSRNSDARRHATSLDMFRAPRQAHISTW